MTTRSTVSHQLPGPSSQSIPERDASAWGTRLQRVRAVLRGAVRSTWTGQSLEAPTPAVAVSEVVTDAPPVSGPRLHREDDRTTRVYQRPAIECGLVPLLGRGESPPEEVSTTCRLPSADLEALLLQLQYDAGSQSAAPEPAPATEMEVSSITFEELEAFRRSLVDSSAASDEEVSSPAIIPSAPPSALSTKTTAGSMSRRRLQSAKEMILRRMGALATRCMLLLRGLGLALTSTVIKFRARHYRTKQPGLIASESRAETTDEASASK